MRLRFTDTTYLIPTAHVQSRFDQVNDVRVLHQATPAVDVTEHARFTAEYHLSDDSRPPASVEDLNLRLSNDLQILF